MCTLQLLLELPGVKEEDVAKLEERIQQSTQNNPTGKTSKHDKAKKDIFRKIVSGVRILIYLLTIFSCLYLGGVLMT